MRYEQKVHENLRRLLGGSYRASPSLFFRDDGGQRFVIPDGVWKLNDDTFVVIEVKAQHMPEAWWQLRRLYQPVLQAIVPFVMVVEVVNRYDPQMPFPEVVKLINQKEQVQELLSADDFGVWIWPL